MVEATTRPALKRRVPLYLMVIGGVLLALVIAYWLGRWQVGADFSAYRTEQARAREAAAAAAEQLQGRIDVLEGRVRLLEGRRQMHLALLALDARNFGVAKGHLEKAAALLGEGALRVPGIDREAARGLAAELEAVRMVAAEDFTRQRAQLLDWTRRWDKMIPPAAGDEAGAGASAAPALPPR